MMLPSVKKTDYCNELSVVKFKISHSSHLTSVSRSNGTNYHVTVMRIFCFWAIVHDHISK